MTGQADRPPTVTRRQLLAGTGLASAALATGATSLVPVPPAGAATHADTASSTTVPFHGSHQSGVATPEQAHLVFAAFDATVADRAGLAALLDTWTDAAGRLTAGLPVAGRSALLAPPPDSGEALGLGPSRLTLTVGFGPGLFDSRFGLAPMRPDALVDLPPFAGDALDPLRTGGDLCIQACADDAQVAFHAVHNLSRLAQGSATVRYLQVGFGRTASPGAGQPTPRNLLGFRDGTNNLVADDEGAMNKFVWVDSPGWMSGGTYLVARRIRTHLEAWDRSTLDEQERTIGRIKANGAPLGAAHETAPVDLHAIGSDGQPLIPTHAHIRVAAPSSHGGQAILRRGYSFVDGIDPVTGELDAGLFFICFQNDPRKQFIPIQQSLSQRDALVEYLEHTGSGIFACPSGIQPRQSWGHHLV